MNPLIFFYRDFNIPQNLFGKFACRRADGENHIRRVEVGDCPEITLVKLGFRVQTAPRHERVCDAVRKRFDKGVFQERIVALFKRHTFGIV
jgi:hypothetical protein